MQKNYSLRDFIKKTALSMLLSLSALGFSCDKKENGEPLVTNPELEFQSNTGFVSYTNFFGFDDSGVTALRARYNDNSSFENYEITGRDPNGLLASGQIPLTITKEITNPTNTLEFYVLDNENKPSSVHTITFHVPKKEDALNNIRGILLREGGYHHFESDQIIDVPGFGEVIAPILITRLDKEGNGQSVIDYIGIRENLNESYARRDAISNAGYGDLFVIRGRNEEVNSLTAQFVREGYKTLRNIPQNH